MSFAAATKRAAPRSTRRRPSAAFARPSITPRTARSRTPAGACHGQGHALRPAGAGSRVAERRGRCAPSPRGGRRARPEAAQLPQRRAADGVGGRRRRRRRASTKSTSWPRRRAHHATLIGEVVRMLQQRADAVDVRRALTGQPLRFTVDAPRVFLLHRGTAQYRPHASLSGVVALQHRQSLRRRRSRCSGSVRAGLRCS
jgi:hypothetical protein